MIIGIGHDITSLTRIKKIYDGQLKSKFIARILTEHEQMQMVHYSLNRQQEYLAGRFAAKEAVSKAFGCGIGEKIRFQDIEIKKNNDGKPVVVLSDDSLQKLGYAHESLIIHVTITHDQQLASAFVVVEKV